MRSPGFLLLLIFALWAVEVFAKTYRLPYSWNVTNSAQYLPEYVGSEGKYRVLRTGHGGNDLMQSDNGTFCLAFYEFNNNLGNFYLSVVMGCSNNVSIGVPVWIAQQKCAAKEKSALLLGRINSKFILLNSGSENGGLIWESSTNVSSTELNESGNWIMYNNERQVIWQSFDFPSDVILPWQSLASPSMLMSRKNSSTGEQGIYTATIEHNRLVFYLNITGKVQPYFVKTSSSDLCKQASLIYKPNNLEISFADSNISSTCKPEMLWQFLSPITSNALQFIRLEADGNLALHRLNMNTMMWNTSKMFHDPCQLPLTCGPFGICQNNGQCECLLEDNTTVEANASLKPSNAKCSPPHSGSAPCNENTERNNHFVPTGNYFSNPYSTGMIGYTLKSCKNLCLSNCSCAAFFFFQNKCFIVDEILGGFVNDSSSQGFIKFRNDVLLTGSIGINSSGNGINTKAMVGAVLTACGIITILVLAKIVFCRKKSAQNADNQAIHACLSGLDGLPPRFTYEELEIATEGFSRKLGTGGFGSVYGGVLPNGKKVAVKKLEGTTQGVKQFVAEVASMANINHVNIVRLCGFCIENQNQMLVYDFMCNGSLDHWLFGDNKKKGVLDWGTRVEIATGTARGLAYLHEDCREPIIHLDVKPQNILLDEKMVPKVADFGMAKQVDRDVSQVVTCVRGTPGYLAPEWLMHSLATKKCDVYSFGMVLLELIGGRKNLDVVNKKEDLKWYFPAWAVNEVREGRMMEIIDPKISAFVSEKQGSRLIHLALWCIQENPSMRPSMEEVVQVLEGIKEVEKPPLKFHFAVPTQTIMNFMASEQGIGMSYINTESVSMAYVNPPSFGMSSLIR